MNMGTNPFLKYIPLTYSPSRFISKLKSGMALTTVPENLDLLQYE